jgi:hypothetical protein
MLGGGRVTQGTTKYQYPRTMEGRKIVQDERYARIDVLFVQIPLKH